MWRSGSAGSAAKLALFLVLSLEMSAATAARANDGGIALGGSPRLLRQHPSVRMVSERVQMDVYETSLKVTCDFDFYNSGPACAVRMGFPDTGEGAYDPDEEDPDAMHKPPKTTFESFESVVDGKPVATKLIRANKEGHYWHTKTVPFPARRHVRIRDIYTQHIGGHVTDHGTFANIGYILHTGSSWHGAIWKSTLLVQFHRNSMRGTLTTRPIPGNLDAHHWESDSPMHVYYYGMARPTVTGDTLTFVRTGWRPTEMDDLTLVFRDWNTQSRTSGPK